MDFAADAVFDVVAPPTRSAPARQQSKADDGPSFDDHLESAAAEAEPPPRAEAAKEAPAEDASQTQETKESAAKAETPAEPSEPAVPAFVVQIVTPPTPTAPVEATPETTALAASDSETATPAPTAPQQPAQAPRPVDGAPKSDAAKADASENKAANAPIVNAPAAPEASATQSATAPPVAPATTQPVTQTSATPAPPPETMQAVAATQTPREATLRTPKAAPGAAEPKAEAQATDSKSARIDAAQSKAAPPTPVNAARDGGAQAPAPTPISVDTSAPQPSPSGQSGLIQQAAQTQQTAAIDHNAVRAAPATAQVAREIVRRFNGQTTSFDLRLDPPELGRVEIRLEVTRDHRVTAVVAADNPQALAELARHARDLEQTLQSAGLELTDNGLSFDLRQGSEGRADADSGNGGDVASAETQTEQPAMTSRPLGFERWRGVRVDMMV